MNLPINEPDTTRKAKILVADDEEAIRTMVREVLRELGHDVFEATNGNDALSKAQEHRPDLVLLDIRMPGPSGIDVCRKLREDERTRDAAIIVISGLEGSVALEESIIAGADDFLQKPFEAVELIVRVRSMLRVRHIHDEAERVEAYIKNLQELRKRKIG